ncbi:MAG: hypothetical protein VX335_02855, partial [Pseudomonadota bacterium]|nr:hypothetical protein [Pseudomonadota bacterium]
MNSMRMMMSNHHFSNITKKTLAAFFFPILDLAESFVGFLLGYVIAYYIIYPFQAALAGLSGMALHLSILSINTLPGVGVALILLSAAAIFLEQAKEFSIPSRMLFVLGTTVLITAIMILISSAPYAIALALGAKSIVGASLWSLNVFSYLAISGCSIYFLVLITNSIKKIFYPLSNDLAKIKKYISGNGMVDMLPIITPFNQVEAQNDIDYNAFSDYIFNHGQKLFIVNRFTLNHRELILTTQQLRNALLAQGDNNEFGIMVINLANNTMSDLQFTSFFDGTLSCLRLSPEYTDTIINLANNNIAGANDLIQKMSQPARNFFAEARQGQVDAQGREETVINNPIMTQNEVLNLFNDGVEEVLNLFNAGVEMLEQQPLLSNNNEGTVAPTTILLGGESDPLLEDNNLKLGYIENPVTSS